MTISHVKEHIIYGDMPASQHAKIAKYFEKYNGCSPKNCLESQTQWPVVFGAPFIGIGALLGTTFDNMLFFIGSLLVGLAIAGSIALSFHRTGKKYFNNNHVICIAPGSTSKHGWAGTSGFAGPWDDYTNACRRYKDQIAKLPEGAFVEDVDFYSVAVDVFKVFREKYALSKVVDRFEMNGDFKELQEITSEMKQFSDRCSKIVHTTNRVQQKTFISNVASSVSTLNATAEAKLESIGELENPVKKKPFNKPIVIDAETGEITSTDIKDAKVYYRKSDGDFVIEAYERHRQHAKQMKVISPKEA